MQFYTIRILENIMQLDPNDRGIHRIPEDNLCTRTQGHLLRAAMKISEHPGAKIALITGFYIPGAHPPAPETDGPLGALALARGLSALGYQMVLVTDDRCAGILHSGIDFYAKEFKEVKVMEIVDREGAEELLSRRSLHILIAVERVGPCHNRDSFLAQHPGVDVGDFERHGPGSLSGRCLNMRGEPVTDSMYTLFEAAGDLITIGIGDGGNEVGMGSIPWEAIHRNISSGLGGKIACRIPAHHTIVAGISNWGAYALLAAVLHLLGKPELFDIFCDGRRETAFMRMLCRKKLAVDGTTGRPAMSVDGIDWAIHLSVLNLIDRAIMSP